jgi:hypothetical protein
MYVSFQKITLLQNSRGLKRKNQQQQKQTNKQIINNKNKNKSFLWICLIKQSILLNMRLDDIFSFFFSLRKCRMDGDFNKRAGHPTEENK